MKTKNYVIMASSLLVAALFIGVAMTPVTANVKIESAISPQIVDSTKREESMVVTEVVKEVIEDCPCTTEADENQVGEAISIGGGQAQLDEAEESQTLEFIELDPPGCPNETCPELILGAIIDTGGEIYEFLLETPLGYNLYQLISFLLDPDTIQTIRSIVLSGFEFFGIDEEDIQLILTTVVIPVVSTIITAIVTEILNNIDFIIAIGISVVEYLLYVVVPYVIENLPEILLGLWNLYLTICDILFGDDCEDCDGEQTVVLGGFTGGVSGGFIGASLPATASTNTMNTGAGATTGASNNAPQSTSTGSTTSALLFGSGAL